MGAIDKGLSRISKLFVDRDQTAPELILERRRTFHVTLACGGDVADSYTLQLAVLTAARTAVRCFPSAVRAIIPPALASAPSKLWPHKRRDFRQRLLEILGGEGVSIAENGAHSGRVIVFGNAPESESALRVTFDGWVACIGPARSTPRMREREYCSLAGILAGSLAVSELFMSFAGIGLQAGRRTVSQSLWRPDLRASEPEALGKPVQFLPKAVWVLGLGHLGNAYVWALASLPYRSTKEVMLFLNDFDKVEDANVETGVLFELTDVGKLKTRTLDRFALDLGFETRLLERRFDPQFRLQQDEPELALCGFDSNLARRYLATAGFSRAIESGLGGTPNNFDVVSLHTFPNVRSPHDLWPDLDAGERQKQATLHEHLAQKNRGYESLSNDVCGKVLLAGKSIAVPFVGTTAAAFVVAETLRLLHEGPAYGHLKFCLAMPETVSYDHIENYKAQDCAGIQSVGCSD